MEKRLNLRSFLIINLGTIITALGIYLFMMPSQIAAGGVSGLAIIINRILPQFSVGLIMLVFNIILFILAFIVIGKEFVGLTVYNSLLLSALIYVFERLIPINGPIIDDLLVNLIYGILIGGVGMALSSTKMLQLAVPI